MFSTFSKLAICILALGLMVSGPAWASGHGGGGEKKEAKKAEGGHGGGESSGGGDGLKARYVKVPPLILPVIGDNGVEQIVSIVVILEAVDKDAADSISEQVPRLNDAYVTEMYGALDRRERMKNGVIDIPYIKGRLTELTNKIIGPEKFKSLLIQGVSQHQS